MLRNSRACKPIACRKLASAVVIGGTSLGQRRKRSFAGRERAGIEVFLREPDGVLRPARGGDTQKRRDADDDGGGQLAAGGDRLAGAVPEHLSLHLRAGDLRTRLYTAPDEREPPLLVDHLHPGLARLVELRAGAGAGDEDVGLLRNRP